MTKYNLTEKKGQAAYCKHIRKEMIDKLSKKIKYIIVNKKKETINELRKLIKESLVKCLHPDKFK